MFHSQVFLEAPVAPGLQQLRLPLRTQPERKQLIQVKQQLITLITARLSSKVTPVQEDQCCQAIQEVLGDQRGPQARQAHGHLSARHVPEKSHYTTKSHSTLLYSGG